MARGHALDTLNCPKCGAPLDFATGQDTTRCAFCGSQVVRSRQDASAPLTIDFQVPMSAPQGQVGSRSGARMAVLLVLFIACVTLVPIGLAMLNMAQVSHLIEALVSGDIDVAFTAVPTLNKRIRVGASAALVPSLVDAPPDIVALTTHYPLDEGEQEHRLVSLSSVKPTLLWQSETLGQDTYSVPILAHDEFVYVVEEMRLLALQRADGSTAWEAPLPDVVSLQICRECVRVLEGRLFTLSDDGTLLATDGRTGEPLWDFRAVQDSPRGLYVLGDRIAFIDQDEDNEGLLRLFDPASGEMQTLQPTCASDFHVDYADWTTPLYPAPDGVSFYIVFGIFQTCAQRWDVEDMTLLWSSKVPDDFGHEEFLLVTEEAIYLERGIQVLKLDAETGASKVLVEDEAYDFVPLTMVNDHLLVRATRTRGSKRFEIWSVACRGDGVVNWTFDLGDNPPLDPPDAAHSIIDVDAPVWTWRVMADQLLLLRFRRAADDVSHALLMETLNVQTGISSGVREIPLGVSTTILSAPEFVLWQQDTAWMSIEGKLLGFDVVAGEIVYRWP